MTSKSLGIGAFAGTLLALGAFIGYTQIEFDRTLAKATVLDAPEILADFSLLDHTEQAFDRENLSGQWSLVFFGFTNCPDICPVTLAKLAQVVDQVSPPLTVIFVSVDPKRDTPGVLAQYIQTFGERFIGLTGDPVEIDRLAKSFFAPYSLSGEGENYNVIHSSSVFLVNRDGQFAAFFSAPIESKVLVEDLRKII